MTAIAHPAWYYSPGSLSGAWMSRCASLLAGDPSENVVIDLAGPFHLQEMTCMLDHDHARRRGEQALGAAGQFHPDAAVVGSVQVQGGLRRLPAGGFLLGRVARGAIGRVPRWVLDARSAVVTDRGRQVGGLAQGLLDPGQLAAGREQMKSARLPRRPWRH